MKLPTFLPKEFDHLKEAEGESDLFNKISVSFPLAIQFLRAISDDESWCATHSKFMLHLMRWLTQAFYSEQLGIDLAHEVADIVHSKSDVLSPFIDYDMIVEAGGEKLGANSLLLATSSSYFNGLISQMRERSDREKTLKLREADPEKISQLLEIIHKGEGDLWKKNSEELETILTQSRSWELKKTAGSSEEFLALHLNRDNAMETLLKARKKQWYGLQSQAAVIYNENPTGLRIFIDPYNELIASFRDLKQLTTLEEYSKVAPFITICHFPENLAAEEGFETVINMTPKLIGLDFTDSQLPPNLDHVPNKLQVLGLSRASWVSDDIVLKLLEKSKNLARLYLKKCFSLTKSSWSKIGAFELEDLDLEDSTLKDEDISLLSLNVRKLEHLNLSGCKKLTSKGLEDILRESTRLLDLNLSKTAVSDQTISDIVQRQTRLESLNLSFSKNISERAILSLIKNRPTLYRLNLSGSNLGEERIQTLIRTYPAIKFN